MGTGLGRPVMDLDLPRVKFTLAELLAALAEAEPRIARYLRGDDGQPPSSLRPLLNDHLLEPDTPIPTASPSPSSTPWLAERAKNS